MLSRKNRAAISYIEILVAGVLVAASVIPYLTLSVREIVWTGEIEDRIKASTLASNLMSLVQTGHKDILNAGTVQSDGTYLTLLPCDKISDSNLALGVALFKWFNAKRSNNKLKIQLTWHPASPNTNGKNVVSAGLINCKVSWNTNRGKARSVKTFRVINR